MILFILEGERPDVMLYRAMMDICGVGKDSVEVVYGCNIDALYHELMDLGEGADIVGVLRNKYQHLPNNPFNSISRSDQISEIYLIFDYDFHDIKRSPDELNRQLFYLLKYFSEETDHGKLYINYPMVEAIRYTKALPDTNYCQYTVCREDCRSFKHLASSFSFYSNFDYLTRGPFSERARNWELLKVQNVAKANYICSGENVYPPNGLQAITQMAILCNQIAKYESLPDCRVSVLSSFPLIIYDWLGY